jgi:hypothetical protein
MAFGVIDVVVLLIILYAFIVAIYNTFVSDCTLAGSANFGRKLATWIVAWPIMLLCKSTKAPVPTISATPTTTSFSYSTEI